MGASESQGRRRAGRVATAGAAMTGRGTGAGASEA